MVITIILHFGCINIIFPDFILDHGLMNSSSVGAKLLKIWHKIMACTVFFRKGIYRRKKWNIPKGFFRVRRFQTCKGPFVPSMLFCDLQWPFVTFKVFFFYLKWPFVTLNDLFWHSRTFWVHRRINEKCTFSYCWNPKKLYFKKTYMKTFSNLF